MERQKVAAGGKGSKPSGWFASSWRCGSAHRLVEYGALLPRAWSLTYRDQRAGQLSTCKFNLGLDPNLPVSGQYQYILIDIRP